MYSGYRAWVASAAGSAPAGRMVSIRPCTVRLLNRAGAWAGRTHGPGGTRWIVRKSYHEVNGW